MKTKSQFRRIVFLVLILMLVQCKKIESTESAEMVDATAIITTDSSVANVDSAAAVVDSAGAMVDAGKASASASENHDFSQEYFTEDETSEKNDNYTGSSGENNAPNQPAIDVEKLYANTLIYAPENMSKESEYTILAMVNLNDIKTSIGAMSIKAQELNPTQINTKDIKTKENSPVTNKIKVTLKYDEEVFEEISSNDGLMQILDENQKEISWNWTLKPKKCTSNAHLTFIFQSMEDNKVLFEEKKFVNVNISVANTFRGYLQYLADEPKYTIPSIILPLITFFAGRFLRRKKEKETGPEQK